MRYLFLLLLILITSCATHKSDVRSVKMIMTVYEIKGDSAVLKTPHFGTQFYASSKGRELGETKYFFGEAFPSDLPGEFHFKIRKAFPVNDTLGIRRALKIDRYLIFNAPLK